MGVIVQWVVTVWVLVVMGLMGLMWWAGGR